MPKQFTEAEVIERIEDMRRRRPRFTDTRITMSHGSGGKASRQLVEGLIVPLLDNPALACLGDAARVQVEGATLALTTDSFVVHPLAFPGGSIGELAVNGTVNDLAAAGARPISLAAAMILEEGLDAEVLRGELEAMAAAAQRAGVPVVTGDTKVVERGKADGLYITTTGVGLVASDVALAPELVQPGDKVLVSGTVGDHGMAIMLARGQVELDADIRSDTAPLWPLAEALLATCGADLHCMRDATRGGVATVLNEIVLTCQLGAVVIEDKVPLRPEVVGACELLGIDPLYVANEGKLVAFVAPDRADEALEALRAHPTGAAAAIIGEVAEEPAGRVLGRTGFGGHRMIDMLVGDPLPRIC
ncbi:hydrogenase expression/formation protein HypE [soil metagenome]